MMHIKYCRKCLRAFDTATNRDLCPECFHEDERRRDAARLAKPAGKRISKTGHIYWENRRNRSDRLLNNI